MKELELAERVLDLAAAAGRAEVEVAVDRNRLALTRFANSVIHQNVAEDTAAVRVRVHRDGRTASASSTLIDDDGLHDLVSRALDTVRVAPRDPGWPGLAPLAAPGSVAAADEETAQAGPDGRAARVQAFVAAAGGAETAGYCRTNHWSGAFVDSAGQSVAGASTEAGMDGIVRRSGIDGVARQASRRLADIDGAVLGARAAAKAAAAGDPVELPPGRYEVVLEATAVADVLANLGLYGFNAKAVAERRSFTLVGESQFDPSLTIVDDAPAAGSPYDVEGTPHRRLVLVDAGTTAALTHDRRTAAQAGDESTGHAIGMAAFGAVGRNLGIVAAHDTDDTGDTGDSPAEVDGPAADTSIAELVAGIVRGLLVTDFWYTRVLDPRALAVTGLTRNGVWLIEDGEITTAVANMRFTQSYAQALMPGAVLGVGRAAVCLPGDTYSASAPRWTAPALHLASWNFTGGASG